jgi:hypothetical protein
MGRRRWFPVRRIHNAIELHSQPAIAVQRERFAGGNSCAHKAVGMAQTRNFRGGSLLVPDLAAIPAWRQVIYGRVPLV